MNGWMEGGREEEREGSSLMDDERRERWEEEIGEMDKGARNDLLFTLTTRTDG